MNGDQSAPFVMQQPSAELAAAQRALGALLARGDRSLLDDYVALLSPGLFADVVVANMVRVRLSGHFCHQLVVRPDTAASVLALPALLGFHILYQLAGQECEDGRTTATV